MVSPTGREDSELRRILKESFHGRFQLITPGGYHGKEPYAPHDDNFLYVHQVIMR